MDTDDATIAVFVGPTASGLAASLRPYEARGVKFFPPVKRGDLPALDARYTTVAIVDGFFHSVPAVGHVEIREAIAAGRTVYGCSSMGAIRAYEMRDRGMIGFGRVYEMFTQFEDFTDDELAQLHGPAPDFVPLSEALVNVRVYVSTLLNEGTLLPAQGRAILETLASRYYGHRTLKAFQEELHKHVPALADLERLIERYVRTRAKSQDFLHLLECLVSHEVALS